jgi:hypothetical protein
MAEAEVIVQSAALEPAPSAALERQVAAEQTMMRSIVHGILIALPFTIAFTIGLVGIAISDKQPWYVWVGLGAGIGAYAAGLFGSIAAVMFTAHLLDEPSELEEHAGPPGH